MNQINAEHDICPFAGHKILKSRMASHISRCKNQHPDFKQCPFNSLHFYQNLEEHLLTCPEKKSLADTIKISTDPNFQTQETCNVVCDEEWSDNEGTYDPRVKHEHFDGVWKGKSLMTQTERKAFAESERIRLNQLRNN